VKRSIISVSNLGLEVDHRDGIDGCRTWPMLGELRYYCVLTLIEVPTSCKKTTFVNRCNEPGLSGDKT